MKLELPYAEKDIERVARKLIAIVGREMVAGNKEAERLVKMAMREAEFA